MTSYTVLVYEGDGTWKEAGSYTAHSADAACKAALSEQQIPSARAVGVPARSWKPEQFNAQMRFVFGGKPGAGVTKATPKPEPEEAPETKAAPVSEAPAPTAPEPDDAAPPDEAA